MISSGIFVEPQAQRPPIFRGLMRDASALMTQAARAASEMVGGRRPQLLLVLKPDADQASYFQIKRISDTELGLPSQCCIDKHVFKCNRQYAANVVLKINAKLGGINLTLVDNLPKFEQPTMIFGADVTHPAAGEKSQVRKKTCCLLLAACCLLLAPCCLPRFQIGQLDLFKLANPSPHNVAAVNRGRCR